MRACVLAVCVWAAGCGGPATPDRATARGRVLVNGRPLAGGRVVFAPHPDRGPLAGKATADLDANGEFRLTCDGSAYLSPGWYRVAVADPPSAEPTGFPPALRRPDRSGLERELVPGKENVFVFHIDVPAAP